MSDKKSPSPYMLKSSCACGAHSSQAEHERAFTAITASAADDEKMFGSYVERAILRAIVPNPLQRRAFLQAVGASTAAAAADGSLSRQRSATTIMLSPARSEMGARSPWRMMMML